MPEQPADRDIRTWHRRFAMEANNQTWSLSERVQLTADEKTDLLYAAYAAAHHWSKIGTEKQVVLAELLLARVHALLGHGDFAMRFATAAFSSIMSRESAPWEIAFAHAILADAAAASGDSRLHAEQYSKAKALGAALADPQDKGIFLRTFHLIPAPDGERGTG